MGERTTFDPEGRTCLFHHPILTRERCRWGHVPGEVPDQGVSGDDSVASATTTTQGPPPTPEQEQNTHPNHGPQPDPPTWQQNVVREEHGMCGAVLGNGYICILPAAPTPEQEPPSDPRWDAVSGVLEDAMDLVDEEAAAEALAVLATLRGEVERLRGRTHEIQEAESKRLAEMESYVERHKVTHAEALRVVRDDATIVNHGYGPSTYHEYRLAGLVEEVERLRGALDAALDRERRLVANVGDDGWPFEYLDFWVPTVQPVLAEMHAALHPEPTQEGEWPQ